MRATTRHCTPVAPQPALRVLTHTNPTHPPQEMEIDMRTTMAMEGVVVVAVDVVRTGTGEYGLAPRVRVTTRGMWTGEGALLAELTKVRARRLWCGKQGRRRSGGDACVLQAVGDAVTRTHFAYRTPPYLLDMVHTKRNDSEPLRAMHCTMPCRPLTRR